MFEQISVKSFINRAHLGEYAEIEFDTYIDQRGKEEVLDVRFPIHYFEAGQGAPLILLHGLGQSIYTWRKNFKALAEKFHVFAIDLPGHGYSGKPQISYSVEEFALAIEAFMNVKRIEKAHFCAFCESAVYLLDFVLHNPGRAGGLIIISPSISDGAKGRSRGVQSVFGTTSQKMMLSPGVVRGVLEDCYFDQTLVTDEVVQEYYDGLADKEFKQIARLCMANFYDEDVITGISAVKNPILVCLALEDKVTGGEENNFLSLGIEKGSVFTVRNCGFLLHEEKPERVNEAIAAFLAAD